MISWLDVDIDEMELDPIKNLYKIWHNTMSN